MRGFLQHSARQFARMLAIVLVAGFLCALLVRYAPGATVDERELNTRAGEDSLAALRAAKEIHGSVGANFVHYLAELTRGDLGYSESNNAPIAQLIADRAPATLRELGLGLLGAWVLGFAFAIPAGRSPRVSIYDACTTAGSGLLLSLPAALVAYLCLLAGAASATVLVIVLTPRIFQFSKNILAQSGAAPHVEIARARGVSEFRIFFAHVLTPSAPQLIALAAASVSIALGAAIPIEAICDVGGIGRLAWQAAMSRDLPLLVNLTMLVAIAATAAGTLSEFALHGPGDPADRDRRGPGHRFSWPDNIRRGAAIPGGELASSRMATALPVTAGARVESPRGSVSRTGMLCGAVIPGSESVHSLRALWGRHSWRRDGFLAGFMCAGTLPTRGPLVLCHCET